jgi:hypothetical protein
VYVPLGGVLALVLELAVQRIFVLMIRQVVGSNPTRPAK